MALTYEPQGLESIHPRHENIDEQEIEIAGLAQSQPFAAIAGGDHAVDGAFEHAGGMVP